MQMPTETEKSIFFFLDEFGNLGRLPGFSSLITAVRKRRVSVSLVLQSITQLNEMYGDNGAEIIMENCASKLYFPGLSIKTCEMLSRTLGKKTVFYDAKEFSESDVVLQQELKQKREVAKPLLFPDEIRRMEKNKALFLHSNLAPMMLDILPYYENREIGR